MTIGFLWNFLLFLHHLTRSIGDKVGKFSFTMCVISPVISMTGFSQLKFSSVKSKWFTHCVKGTQKCHLNRMAGEIVAEESEKTRLCWCCYLVPGQHHHPRQILPFIINWKNERRERNDQISPSLSQRVSHKRQRQSSGEHTTTNAPCFAAVVDSGGAERRQDRVSRAKWDTVRRSSITCWSSD